MGMELVVPCVAVLDTIKPVYSKTAKRRRPYSLETILRFQLLQNGTHLAIGRLTKPGTKIYVAAFRRSAFRVEACRTRPQSLSHKIVQSKAVKDLR